MEDEFLSEEELGRFKTHGTDVRVSKWAIIKHPECIELGNHVAIDPFVYINTSMKIGNYVHIAPFSGIFGGKEAFCEFKDYSGVSQDVKIVCGTDDYKGESLSNPTVPAKYKKVTHGTVVLERYVLVGTNVTILPNVIIGEGCSVGACALITKSLDPWGIYIGIPAKRYAERKKDIILAYAKEIEDLGI